MYIHYRTEEEAASKWYRRAKRVNFDDLLIIGMDQIRCTEQDIRSFDKLPYQRKIFFSIHQIDGVESNCYMPEFAGKDAVGDAYKHADVFYKYMVEKFDSTCK